jgi:hypothetical protein
MQPITCACVALVFFSCLTIAWAGALFEVVVPGLISAVLGGVVGAILGTGNTFIVWIIVGIIVSGVVHLAYSIRLAPKFLMAGFASSVGVAISALIVSDLTKFYKYDSQSGYKFKSVEAAYLGAAVAGIIGTGYWAVMTAAIIAAFRIAIQSFISKGFCLYIATVILLFVAVAGFAIGIVFRITGFYHQPTIYAVALIDLILILMLLYTPNK